MDTELNERSDQKTLLQIKKNISTSDKAIYNLYME